MTESVYPGAPFDAVVSAQGAAPTDGSIVLLVGRAGLGKTAVSCHAGLSALLSGEQVLHVALRDTVDHARAHWDEVLRATMAHATLSEAALRAERARVIHSFQGRPFEPAIVSRNLTVLEEAAQFKPSMVVFDGFEGLSELAPHLDAIRGLAFARRFRCLIAVTTDATADPATDPTAHGADSNLARLASDTRFQWVLALLPQPPFIRLAVVRGPVLDSPPLMLDPSSLLVVDEHAAAAAESVTRRADQRVKPRDCTLYSGGAVGSETAFGEAAERFGAHEVNFTFHGHLQARTRGRYELSPKELAVGDVSLAYVSKRLNRSYSDRAGLIRGVLQTLWHMVSRSQQVFVIGRIQDDGTVVGGTGWSVELARMWNRDLWVFDQDKAAWFRWDGIGWALGMPLISAPHLCGTGTRYLNDAGRTAIAELFQRSFAEAPEVSGAQPQA